MTNAMPGTLPDVIDTARGWLADDPDPETQAELAQLISRADEGDSDALADLGDRFRGLLEFGTAGLRGALGAGPNRMNRAVVLRAAAGLAAYLSDHGHVSVVIGYDARHKSDVFAQDTARVMAAAGIRTLVLPRPLPTPVTAYAIRALGMDAAVVVTASHNPPQDNGYKVYVGPSQIVAPIDAEVSAHIAEVGTVASIRTAEDGWETLDDAIVESYVERAVQVVDPASPRDLRIVYTPLHGVGADVVSRVLSRAGFADVHVVPSQGEPDPDFPTLAFPNPEEPGAMDAAFAFAAEVEADVVIANDPDADRCAVAVPTPEGGWQLLLGDELGALLAVHLLRHESTLSGTFATSIVSSSLLAKIAAAHEVECVETLTGFKWLARVEGLRYAYEEALGYCVDPAAVLDKDGITALLLAAELAAEAKAEGRSVLDGLDEIALEHGLFVTSQVSARVDLAGVEAIMQGLREHVLTELGGHAVEAYDDLALGGDSLPPTEALRFRLEGGGRVVIRPSGTEPKIKCYLEVVVPVLGGDVLAAREIAARELDALRADVNLLLGV